jgi:hypothetical protein
MWQDYKAAADCLVEHVGKLRPVADAKPDDFAVLLIFGSSTARI